MKDKELDNLYANALKARAAAEEEEEDKRKEKRLKKLRVLVKVDLIKKPITHWYSWKAMCPKCDSELKGEFVESVENVGIYYHYYYCDCCDYEYVNR